MPAYVANHEKKKRIFAKRERELIHAIKNCFPDDKVLVAAEKLREAKMNVFKCDFSKCSINQPHTFSPEKVATNTPKVQIWLSMSSDDIIEMYRAKAP